MTKQQVVHLTIMPLRSLNNILNYSLSKLHYLKFMQCEVSTHPYHHKLLHTKSNLYSKKTTMKQFR